MTSKFTDAIEFDALRPRLKALLELHRVAQTEEARAALSRLERHYLRHPVAGGWYDQFDRDGRSLVATIPASSLYHVLSAVTEAERVLG